MPIAAEDYSGYVSATYYSVAVARRTDSYLTLFNLKGKLFVNRRVEDLLHNILLWIFYMY